ncbi:MAG: 1-acyl-sn-glycerol-3-phosphate acyltransferase [Acidimicrobiales bacterium]
MAIPRPLRRLLAPLMVAIELVLVAFFALTAVVGVLSAPFDRRRRLLRLGAFGMTYFAVELTALAAALGAWLTRAGHPDAWWEAFHFRLLAWALRSVFASARRFLGFTVVVEHPDRPGVLDDPRPVLILARHGGLGDSFALVWLLLDRYERRVRIVLKEVLQWDPFLDVVLNRLGACFLTSDAASREARTALLSDLAGGLRQRDALLLFPEGGNWTPIRWSQALGRLRRDHKHRAAGVAALMPHVLPPRPAGVGACLDGHPGLAVAVVAHTGLDTLTTVREVWRALPFSQAMTVRSWLASPAPAGDDARLHWLTTEWAVVDQWIDSRRGAGDLPRRP